MSNLLSQASLVMIPSGYKEDVVYSQIPTNGNGDLSFTRASNGTRVNSAGLVEVCPWNLVEYSEQFDNAYWNKYQSVITANATTAPNGTTTADKFEYTTTGTAVLYATSSALSSQVYALSCYGKKGTTDILQIGFTLGSGDKIANFNLNTGVITTTSIGVTASIESVGNGWFRCVMSLTTDINTPNIFVNSTSGTTGNFIYIWGAQLNIGSTAKPYFPTTDRLNVPRLTYQNGGGGCPSLLLEKQSTNLITYSEQFDNAAWSANLNASVTANSTSSPDGTINADKIVEDTNNSQHYIGQTTTSINSVAHTISVYAKASERSFLFLFEDSAGGRNAYFDLANGTIGTIGGSATASITSVGNGWYRCSITYTASGTLVRMRCAPAISNGTASYTGNGTSGIFVWGAQVEASSYSTSYIPTTSSSATRVADACSKTGISSLIGQTEGVLFTDFVCNGFEDYGTPLSVNNGSTSNYIWLTTFANGDLRAELYNGSAQASITYSGGVVGQRYKLAFAYKTNDFAMYVNGSLVGTDVSGTTFSGTTLSRVDFNLTNNAIYGKQLLQINQAILFPTRLTNAELASLTTI